MEIFSVRVEDVTALDSESIIETPSSHTITFRVGNTLEYLVWLLFLVTRGTYLVDDILLPIRRCCGQAAAEIRTVFTTFVALYLGGTHTGYFVESSLLLASNSMNPACLSWSVNVYVQEKVAARFS